MSTSAVHQRVRRLEERGVIKGYAAVVDPTALGPAADRLHLHHPARPRGPRRHPRPAARHPRDRGLPLGRRRGELHPQGAGRAPRPTSRTCSPGSVPRPTSRPARPSCCPPPGSEPQRAILAVTARVSATRSRGGERDIQAAAAAGDVDAPEGEGGLVEHGRQGALLAEGGDAAHDVPGGALGVLRVRHRDLLEADRCRHGLQVERPVDRDDAHDQSALALDEQRLEHLGSRDAEGLSGLESVGGRRGLVLVGVQAEVDARTGQRARGRRAGRRVRATCHRWVCRVRGCGCRGGRGAGPRQRDSTRLTSFQLAGSRPAAMAILIASPTRKGTTPRARAVPSERWAKPISHGTPHA